MDENKCTNPVDLVELFERLLFGTYVGKDSYYNEEQIKDACFLKAHELADVAKRMNIVLYCNTSTTTTV